MIRGIGASRTGMAWEQAQTNLISHNVANVNTDGYKRSLAVGREYSALLLRRLGDQVKEGERPAQVGPLGNGAVLDQIALDLAPGSVRQTGIPLDIAIMGPGEFTYLTPGGREYSRNGTFRQDAEGRLVTQEGYPVLAGGAPVGRAGAALTIGQDGVVSLDGVPAGRLDIRGEAPGGTPLMVGALEASNVDLSREMTDLVLSMRAYQVNQRALQMQDETLGRAVNDLGRL